MAALSLRRSALTVFGVVLSLVLVAALASATVGRLWLERKAAALLNERGFGPASLTIAHIGLHETELRDVSLGGPFAMTLPTLKLTYALPELLRGKARKAEISGLHFDMKPSTPLPLPSAPASSPPLPSSASSSASSSTPSSTTTPFALPVTLAQLDALPVQEIDLQNVQIRLPSGTQEIAFTLDARATLRPTPSFTFTLRAPFVKSAGLTVQAQQATLQATLDSSHNRWSGTWNADGIALQGLPETVDLPALEGKGLLTARAQNVLLEGQMQGPSGLPEATFRATIPYDAPTKTQLSLLSLRAPWNEGTVELGKTTLTFDGPQKRLFHVRLNRLSTQGLLRQLTDKPVNATGTLSGLFNLVVQADGSLGQPYGHLRADASGTLALPEDALPGDQPQIALLRNVLRNFHYGKLELKTQEGKDHKTGISLTLEGHNPDVEKGRPVKINVRLGGDVLAFLQQNILNLTHPRQLLEQVPHAKP